MGLAVVLCCGFVTLCFQGQLNVFDKTEVNVIQLVVWRVIMKSITFWWLHGSEDPIVIFVKSPDIS